MKGAVRMIQCMYHEWSNNSEDVYSSKFGWRGAIWYKGTHWVIARIELRIKSRWNY